MNDSAQHILKLKKKTPQCVGCKFYQILSEQVKNKNDKLKKNFKEYLKIDFLDRVFTPLKNSFCGSHEFQ